MARVPGNPQAKLELLRDLDEKTFPHLVGDVLYHVFRHTGIKVVDGPGDGRRDIHSTTPEGHPHITQCKYHRDSSRAVSPRAVEELPIAMLKFGAKCGLFATTGRLTPQTQREFLNDYEQLALAYLEGFDIVDHVLSASFRK